jgi:hypothetical protein
MSVSKAQYQQDETTVVERLKPSAVTRLEQATAHGIDPDQEQSGHDVLAIQVVEHRDCYDTARECCEVIRIVS